jgi:hypothetical protein
MKLKKESGYCAPYAIKYLTGFTDQKVLEMCIADGFKQEWGMEDYEVLRVLRKAAVRYKRMELKRAGLYGIKLKDFVKEKPKGTFLVYTSAHIMCVTNGTIIDPINEGYVGGDRAVTGAWKIKK